MPLCQQILPRQEVHSFVPKVQRLFVGTNIHTVALTADVRSSPMILQKRRLDDRVLRKLFFGRAAICRMPRPFSSRTCS